MTIMKPAIAVVALLAFAACEQRPQGRYTSPGTGPTGEPGRPTAANPTGSSPSPATGGGVPVPPARGGSGGVGGGLQPGLGGTTGSGR
ncbi:hypothetical protein GCM10009416_51380 [Craurococcus roseus]|uniref:Lipoprotein n=1 Tax=Craurococcus roseus TaxID=77585 RepID=A0ABP3RIR0_9PROT